MNAKLVKLVDVETFRRRLWKRMPLVSNEELARKIGVWRRQSTWSARGLGNCQRLLNKNPGSMWKDDPGLVHTTIGLLEDIIGKEVPVSLLRYRFSNLIDRPDTYEKVEIRVSGPWILECLIEDPEVAAWVLRNYDIELGRMR